jgi:uncharacterized membrane protein
MTIENPVPQGKPKQHPVRRAVLRGLAIVLPPLLTIILFLWAWNTIESYVLVPAEGLARDLIVWSISDVQDGIPANLDTADKLIGPDGSVTSFKYRDTVYVPIEGEKGKWIPATIYNKVKEKKSRRLIISTATGKQIYDEYVDIAYLNRAIVIPVFLCLFVLVLYVLGKFMAAGVGRMLWNFFEGLIHRLPIIRNVYSSVKQVTDFIFSEREIQFTRVVAVEYPRKGTWSIAFVTGESMLDIRAAANEPVVSLLIPTSPMPATGFTVTVRKSETVDLDITLDQAVQFIVSCGVVVPLHQQSNSMTAKISAAVLARENDTLPASGVENSNGQGRGSERQKARETQ